MGYLQKIDFSPLKSYWLSLQDGNIKNRGNLAHGHVIFELNVLNMTVYEKAFVDELVRAYICDIVKSSEIDCYVAEGVFESHHYVNQVIEYAKISFPTSVIIDVY